MRYEFKSLLVFNEDEPSINIGGCYAHKEEKEIPLSLNTTW